MPSTEQTEKRVDREAKHETQRIAFTAAITAFEVMTSLDKVELHDLGYKPLTPEQIEEYEVAAIAAAIRAAAIAERLAVWCRKALVARGREAGGG